MKKENLKIIAMITAIVVVIASVLGAIIFMEGQHEDNEENNEGTYIHTIGRNYDVIIDSEGNYTVYVPVVLGSNGLSYIMENLTLESGNCTYKIENTTYGPALNITGSGYVRLSAEVGYTMYIENWEVVNTSGIDPTKGHPIVLSMSNISGRHCEVNESGNITVVTGYNTTDESFRDNICWKNYVNNSLLSLSSPPIVHSFIYVESEKPVEIDLALSEYGGMITNWELSQRFNTTGWHYVEVYTGAITE